MNSQRGTPEERDAARRRVEAIDRQVELDIEAARRLRSEMREDRENAEGNENIAGQGENIAGQGENIGRSGNNGNDQQTGDGLVLGDDDNGSDDNDDDEIGAHLPQNQQQAQRDEQQGQSNANMNNASGQQNGGSNGNGESNDNGDEHLSDGQNDDHNGDDNGNGNVNGINSGPVDAAGINDKGEIDDDHDAQNNQANGQSNGQLKSKQSESKQTERKDNEFQFNNNMNRREIDNVIAQARGLYNRPTANREPNFDELVQRLFDKYTELTNSAVSDQQRRNLEQLTINADNKQGNEIKQIEIELKELYEIAEHNRQSTFDLRVNNLWTTYIELVDEDTVSSLREECDNLTLTANEIDTLMQMEQEKERVDEIEKELTDLYDRTTSSRPLDFEYKVNNLFMELTRIKDIPDTKITSII